MTQRREGMDDDWGRDPAVRSMRRVFGKMEETQKRLLSALSISPLDPRLRLWRKSALRLFERAWAGAVKEGVVMEEKRVADIYAFCFADIVGREDLTIPAEALPDDETAARIVRGLEQ